LLDLTRVTTTTGKVTAIVIAVTALVAAIDALLNKGESVTCRIYSDASWCDPEHQINFSFAKFFDYSTAVAEGDVSADRNNLKLLKYLKNTCDGRHKCEILTPTVFGSIIHTPAQWNQGIQFYYYCGSAKMEGSVYRWDERILTCP